MNFDLQKVLITPKMFVGDAYYRRKVPNYTLTTYDLATRCVKCFVLNETEAKRGSCEISTCIYVYNKEAGEMNEVIFIQIVVPGSNELCSSAQCAYIVLQNFLSTKSPIILLREVIRRLKGTLYKQQ